MTTTNAREEVAIANWEFNVTKGWGNVPETWGPADVPGVAVDQEDHVFVFARGEPPVRIHDRDGKLLESWGSGVFVRPHAIRIGPDQMVYCVDDKGHAVYKFTPAGQLLMKVVRSVSSDYYKAVDPERIETIVEGGPPFNFPTDVAITGDGQLLVSDGYGNARIHRFSPSGNLEESWGSPGLALGQFRHPHGICISPTGSILVSDRFNARVQIFDPHGGFLSAWDARWPNNVVFDKRGNAYVAEMGRAFLYSHEADRTTLPARVSIRDSAGQVLAQLVEDDPAGAGIFFSPHGIAVDSHGDISRSVGCLRSVLTCHFMIETRSW